MTSLDIVHQRMHNQHLGGSAFEQPEDVVRWLGAVQAQDYAGAKWAIAQRTKDTTNAAIDQLFAEGAILRTHVMRPTWHFVMPSDIRWLLKLTGPRVNAVNAYYYRKFELDEAIFARSNMALTKALHGDKQLTRPELAQVLHDNGIVSSGLRLAYLLMRAELDGVICSGPLRGKQFTYASLAERVPSPNTLETDEALAELTRRYFTSHGPASLADYSWWSGLSANEVKTGLEMVKPHLIHEVVDGTTYWFATPTSTPKSPTPTVHLLPNYDEHIVAYKDHRASFEAAVFNDLDPKSDALMAHIIVLNGYVVGGWRRTLEKNKIIITTNLLVPFNKTERAALEFAAERYARFMGTPTSLVIK